MSERNSLHECKNQIGIILGFVELLLDEQGMPDSRRADLLEIQRAAQRLVTLLPSLTTSPPPALPTA
ncbi:MAG: hypothetical protein ABUS56_05025 [Acidobacteriota bacterium]